MVGRPTTIPALGLRPGIGLGLEAPTGTSADGCAMAVLAEEAPAVTGSLVRARARTRELTALFEEVNEGAAAMREARTGWVNRLGVCRISRWAVALVNIPWRARWRAGRC